MSTRRPALIAALAVAALAVAATACSDAGGDDPEYNRIGPIDGPATVNDDAGADQDGAPADGPVRSGAITAGS